MATVTPSDQAADLLQNLSLDSQAKTLEIEPTKTTSVYQYGGVESGISANGQNPSSERSVTPFLPDFMDPSMLYAYPTHPYIYGGYNGTGNEWMAADGVEMSPGGFGGFGYGPCAPYSPATSPIPTIGSDGQLYGPQHYQYHTNFFQLPTPTNGLPAPTQPATSQGELSATVAADQKPLPVETAKVSSGGIVNGGIVKGNNGAAPYRPSYQNQSLNLNNTLGRGAFASSALPSGYQDPKYGYEGQYRNANASFPKANNVPSSRNHNFHQNSSYMGLHHPGPVSGMESSYGYVNTMYQNKFYGQYGNDFRSGYGYGPGGYDSRINGHGWLSVDNKYKARGRGNSYFGYRNESIDGLNELNRGPRAKGFKNQKGFAPVKLMVKGQNVLPSDTLSEEDEMIASPNWELYNRAEFPEDYSDAKYFIIKSYSEDDIHKSIKYNVWASTPNGNKKLDAAYQEAQQKSGGCPVFLFFSVNTSGQFVGLAEMVGPVDFHKNVEYWQQDKWTGCFPVKWHIVKDIPNSLLKHITLENNENKPVTNSRDTQEVKLEQGLKMIKIFKDHSSKTCILDDFGFYEKRQKIIQEKKAKQQQFQKQVLEAKPNDEEEVRNGSQESMEVVSDMINHPTPIAECNGDLKHSENGSVAKVGDTKANKTVASEERIVANGIAHGC